MATEDDPADSYERDIAAMRARAQSLISSTAPSRALGAVTLPPPPPTTRPLSFVPTTQGTPGSLWTDSGVRVRLRSAATYIDADTNGALDPLSGTSERARRAPEPPSPPLDPRLGPAHRAAADRPRRARATPAERPVWGSPAPFLPSPLPLPRVEDVTSLEARRRAFVGAKVVARMPRPRGTAQAGC